MDEYQDTNFAQGMLLRLLVEEHRNVTVVGDDDRPIYRFRGASQKNLLDFRQEFPDAAVVRLELPLRPQDPQGGSRGRQPLPARIDKRLTGRGGRIDLLLALPLRQAQAQAVAAEAERLVAKEGVRPSEIYVLVRSVKSEGQVIGSALEERAVPFRLGSAAYFQRAGCATCSPGCASSPTNDSGAVVRALSPAMVGLRSVDIAELAAAAPASQLGHAVRDRDTLEDRSSRRRSATARRPSCASTARPAAPSTTGGRARSCSG